MTLKRAVLAPMPRASVKTAVRVKPGFLRRTLTPNLTSCHSDSIKRGPPSRLRFVTQTPPDQSLHAASLINRGPTIPLGFAVNCSEIVVNRGFLEVGRRLGGESLRFSASLR